MTVLIKPLEHDCTHPVTEHWINAADDRWHCNVGDCACSRLRLIYRALSLWRDVAR